MSPTPHDAVLAQRLATQRLTGPAASTPEQAVGELLAVQAQDAPLARLAIAQRSGCHTDVVAAAIDAGAIVRTHVLRPTWHYVLREDLPWLLELTAPKIISGMASRHRTLGLDDPAAVSALIDAIASHVAEAPATRAGVQRHLLERGLLERHPLLGQQVGHALALAELNGLIASGPLAAGEHTYAPWTPPKPDRDRDESVAELVLRFCSSHGPVSVADLMRWVRLTKGEITRALATLGDRLNVVEVDGVRLLFGADAPPVAARFGAHLLSTFDEAFLSYRDVPWPRAAGHPLGDAGYRWSEAGGGPVVAGLVDAGTWRRTHKEGRLVVRLDLASGLSRGSVSEVKDAAAAAAARIARPGDAIVFEDGPVPWGVRSPRASR